MIHPESNRRKPASFIPTRPLGDYPERFCAWKIDFRVTKQALRSPPLGLNFNHKQAKGAAVVRPIDFFYRS
jgi:hypothetical protein